MGRFKVGDRVIINPDIPDKTWSKHGFGFHYDTMRKPGIFTLDREYFNKGFYIGDIVYDEEWLLPVPLFKAGDVVQIKPELKHGDDVRFSCNIEMEGLAGKTVTISEVKVHHYTPDKVGEDGCMYLLEDIDWNWSSPMFVLDRKDKFTTKLTTKNYGNENQLQEKGVAISRGDQHEGSRICCRRCKAAITVGYLSHQKVSGE